MRDDRVSSCDCGRYCIWRGIYLRDSACVSRLRKGLSRFYIGLSVPGLGRIRGFVRTVPTQQKQQRDHDENQQDRKEQFSKPEVRERLHGCSSVQGRAAASAALPQIYTTKGSERHKNIAASAAWTISKTMKTHRNRDDG